MTGDPRPPGPSEVRGALRILRAWGDETPPPDAHGAGSPAGLLGGTPRLGRFRLIECIGRGAMGEVWRAEDPNLGRQVALKLVTPGLVDGSTGPRFEREGHAAARLKHHNVITVHEAGEVDGRPYIAMDLAEGESLATTLARETRLPPPRSVAVVADVAAAAAAAHREGIVHRDIKPGNILFDGTGAALLADFGLAHLREQGARLTVEGAVLGTPAYMAPEQAAGEGGVDERADVYALGAVLHHCLTGRPPIAGADASDIVNRKQREDPAPPSRLEPRVDAALDAICLKALSRRPRDRHPDAGALLADLTAWPNGPYSVRFGHVRRALVWARRHRARLAAAAAAVLLLALGTASPFLLDAWRGRRMEARIQAADAAELRGLFVPRDPSGDPGRNALDGVPADDVQRHGLAPLLHRRMHDVLAAGAPGERPDALAHLALAAFSEGSVHERRRAYRRLFTADLEQWRRTVPVEARVAMAEFLAAEPRPVGEAPSPEALVDAAGLLLDAGLAARARRLLDAAEAARPPPRVAALADRLRAAADVLGGPAVPVTLRPGRELPPVPASLTGDPAFVAGAPVRVRLQDLQSLTTGGGRPRPVAALLEYFQPPLDDSDVGLRRTCLAVLRPGVDGLRPVAWSAPPALAGCDADYVRMRARQRTGGDTLIVVAHGLCARPSCAGRLRLLDLERDADDPPDRWRMRDATPGVHFTGAVTSVRLGDFDGDGSAEAWVSTGAAADGLANGVHVLDLPDGDGTARDGTGLLHSWTPQAPGADGRIPADGPGANALDVLLPAEGGPPTGVFYQYGFTGLATLDPDGEGRVPAEARVELGRMGGAVLMDDGAPAAVIAAGSRATDSAHVPHPHGGLVRVRPGPGGSGAVVTPFPPVDDGLGAQVGGVRRVPGHPGLVFHAEFPSVSAGRPPALVIWWPDADGPGGAGPRTLVVRDSAELHGGPWLVPDADGRLRPAVAVRRPESSDVHLLVYGGPDDRKAAGAVPSPSPASPVALLSCGERLLRAGLTAEADSIFRAAMHLPDAPVLREAVRGLVRVHLRRGTPGIGLAELAGRLAQTPDADDRSILAAGMADLAEHPLAWDVPDDLLPPRDLLEPADALALERLHDRAEVTVPDRAWQVTDDWRALGASIDGRTLHLPIPPRSVADPVDGPRPPVDVARCRPFDPGRHFRVVFPVTLDGVVRSAAVTLRLRAVAPGADDDAQAGADDLVVHLRDESQDDDDFDLRIHLRCAGAGPPSTNVQLVPAAGATGPAPLDRERVHLQVEIEWDAFREEAVARVRADGTLLGVGTVPWHAPAAATPGGRALLVRPVIGRVGNSTEQAGGPLELGCPEVFVTPR